MFAKSLITIGALAASVTAQSPAGTVITVNNPGFDEGDFATGFPTGWNAVSAVNELGPVNFVDNAAWQSCGTGANAGNCYDYTFGETGTVSQQLSGTNALTCYAVSFYATNEGVAYSASNAPTLTVTVGTTANQIDLSNIGVSTGPLINGDSSVPQNNQFTQYFAYGLGTGATTELTFAATPGAESYFDIDTVSVVAADSTANGPCAGAVLPSGQLGQRTRRAKRRAHKAQCLNPGFDEGDFTSGNPIGWVNSATIANPTNPSNGVDDLFYQGCGGGNCFDFTFQQPGYVSQQLNGTDASTCYYISFYGANEAYPQDQQLTTSVYSPTTLDVTFGTYVMPIDLTGVATLTDPSLNIPGETTRNNQFSQFSIYARGAGPTTELTFTCSPYYYFDIDTVSVTAIDSSATGECGPMSTAAPNARSRRTRRRAHRPQW